MAGSNIRRPVSPGCCEMAESKLPALPDRIDHSSPKCFGKFCKLKDRLIPADVQRYEVVIGGVVYYYCAFCLRALSDKPVNGVRHLFGNNRMYANGFRNIEQES
jgi:hypothetical protein